MQRKEAKRLETKSLFGAEAYQENVVMNSSIPKRFLSLSNEDREGLRIKMNTVYHVIKNEDLYTDYPKLLKLQTKNGVPQLLKSKTQASYATDDAGAIFGNFIGRYNVDLLKKDLDKINYFSILTDGSTDASITEQEAMFIFFKMMKYQKSSILE